MIALEEKRGLAKDKKTQLRLEIEGNQLRDRLRVSLGKLQDGRQDGGTTFLAFSPALDISVLRQVHSTCRADSVPSPCIPLHSFSHPFSAFLCILFSFISFLSLTFCCHHLFTSHFLPSSFPSFPNTSPSLYILSVATCTVSYHLLHLGYPLAACAVINTCLSPIVTI